MFDLDYLYTLDNEHDIVHPRAFIEMNTMLNAWARRFKDRISLSQDNVGNLFVTGDGKITKRIRSVLAEQYGVKLDGTMMSEIGNIADQHRLRAGRYYLSISDDMDVFNEHHSEVLFKNEDTGNLSCFRPSGEMHNNWLSMDDDPNFYCVRTFAGEYEFNDWRPSSRAWLYVGTPDSIGIYPKEYDRKYECDTVLVLFNSYGIRIDDKAILMSYIFGNTERPLDIAIARAESRLYVNTGNVFILGAGINAPGTLMRADYYANRQNYSIELITRSRPHDWTRCRGCRSWFHIDQTMDGYCEECVEEYLEECGLCGDSEYRDNMYFGLEVNGERHEYVCARCRNITTSCQGCGNRFTDEHMSHFTSMTTGRIHLCESCHDEYSLLYHRCNMCNDHSSDRNMRNVRNGMIGERLNICEECVETLHSCVSCGATIVSRDHSINPMLMPEDFNPDDYCDLCTYRLEAWGRISNMDGVLFYASANTGTSATTGTADLSWLFDELRER